MAESPETQEFKQAGPVALGISGAIQRARDEIVLLTDLKVDAVTRVQRSPDDGWIIVMDLVESIARMGDNDLLATYELTLAGDGALQGMARLARYRREDGA